MGCMIRRLWQHPTPVLPLCLHLNVRKRVSGDTNSAVVDQGVVLDPFIDSSSSWFSIKSKWLPGEQQLADLTAPCGGNRSDVHGLHALPVTITPLQFEGALDVGAWDAMNITDTTPWRNHIKLNFVCCRLRM